MWNSYTNTAIGHTFANTLSLTALSIMSTSIVEQLVVPHLMPAKEKPNMQVLMKMLLTALAMFVIATMIVYATGGDWLYSIFGISPQTQAAAIGGVTVLGDDGVDD
jgi:hypothetical protein